MSSNKPGSNWEESQQQEHAHAAPGKAGAASVHDGFDDSHADSHADSTQDVVDADVRKKSNPMVAKVMVGVMGLAVVGVLGFFGMRVMGTMGGKPAAQLAKAKQITEIARPGTGTTLMGGDPKPVASAQPMTPEVAPIAPIAPVVQAAAPVVAPIVAAINPVAALPMTPIAPVAAPVVPDGRLAQATDRARRLEEENRDLRKQIARQATARVNAPASVKVARATLTDGAPRAPRTHHASSAKVKAGAPMIIEVAEKETLPEITRLQLRGVFPRSGDDMQAWVMDGEKTRSISKGDQINGAKVIRVETDRVVTDHGMIR